MHSLYSENDLGKISFQIRRRRLVLLAIMLCFSAVLAYLLIAVDNGRQNRPELPVMFVLIAAFSVLIFFYELLLHPLTAYARHLRNSLHGRSHEITVLFDHINEEHSMVDGVMYQDLIFLGEADKHGDRERMFYWDVELPLPEFSKGQEVTLRYYDRFIIAYESCSS